MAPERLPQAQMTYTVRDAVELAGARGQLAHRHQHGAGDVAADVLAGLADVDDGGAVGVGGGERLEGDLGHPTPPSTWSRDTQRGI